MPEKTILAWFRNDLRIHDNEILAEAVRKSTQVLPVYCFDPRYFMVSPSGMHKTGPLRAAFLLESVRDLKASLQQLGGDLLIVVGKPEEVIPEIAEKYQVSEVYHHREVASEETDISSMVEAALWKRHINLKHFIGHTLYHKEDLPFPIKDIPDAFATFRKKIERDSMIRKGFGRPEAVRVPAEMETSEVPELYALGLKPQEADERQAVRFRGGETEGLSRMQDYIWQQDFCKADKSVRGRAGIHQSSRLSPWISLGCLSTRRIYWEIKKYERERGTNDATYGLIYELLWRDYFRFMFKKHGTPFFAESTPAEGKPVSDHAFDRWKDGRTGSPFVDANMRELNATGYMSAWGRKAVASFLVRELNVDWTLGARYFEEQLIDYSPASNWGNWAHIAGLRIDPRDSKVTALQKLASECDPRGDYVRRWVPELAAVPGAAIHQADRLSNDELRAYGIDPGVLPNNLLLS